MSLLYFPSYIWQQDPGLDCARSASPGIRRAWASVRSRFGTWLLDETAPRQFASIIGQTGTNDLWYELPILRGSSTLTQEAETDGGPYYTAELTLGIARWDAAGRDAMQQLQGYGDCIFIVEDGNGTYWLVGEYQGCTVTHSATAARRGELSGYTLAASCRQPWPLRTVATSYLDGNVLPPLRKRLCSYSFGELCSLSFSELCTVPL